MSDPGIPPSSGSQGDFDAAAGPSGRRSFAESLKWAFAMNWGQRALGTIFTFVLAAILGPHDFGVVAIALVYIALVQLVLEQGIATAVIQREDLEAEHLDSAFWLNVVWCLGLAGASIGLAGWWAEVNGAPVLRDVVMVLSLLLLVEGLQIVQQAVLQRRAEFKKLALRANVGALCGGVVGLILALWGAGVWSLVAQQLVMDGIALVLIWILSPWRPGFRISVRHTRELLGFSIHVFVANLGGFMNRRADALLLGVFFGPAVVGLYRLADRFVDMLLELTMRPVGLISLPFFSRLQHDREALRQRVATSMRVTLLVSVPPMLMLAACSEELVAVIGSEWEPAADGLKMLALVGIAKAVVFFAGPLLFSVGRPGLRGVMLWALGGLSAAMVVLVAELLQDASADGQVFGMAASRAALFLLVVVPVNGFVVLRLTGLRLGALLAMVPGPLVSGLAAIAAVYGLRATGALGALPRPVALAIAGIVAAAAALGTLLAVDPDARGYLHRARDTLSGSRGRVSQEERVAAG